MKFIAVALSVIALSAFPGIAQEPQASAGAPAAPTQSGTSPHATDASNGTYTTHEANGANGAMGTSNAAPAQPAPDSAAPVAAAAAVEKAGLVSEREIVTRLQIFLDQQNFGPGKIDGRWGEFTGKAVRKYAACHGLEINDQIYDQLPLDSVYPVYTTYTITENDLKWIGPTPHKPEEQAKLKSLLYGNLLFFTAERYHSDPEFLQKINAGKDLEKLQPGDVVRVPNVEPFKIEEVKALGSLPEVAAFKSRYIIINRKERMATLWDAKDGDHVIAAFPITPGSERLPTPPGTWRVVGIASLPTFRWDDGVLNHGKRTDKFYMLPSGPRNPVGVAWIGLSKPGIGLHGTNEPRSIGRAASHGCMRLANWDAVRLAHMITKGIKVVIE